MNLKKIKEYKIPNHVAIILDGNGRWAKKRGMPRTSGHQKGLKTLIEVTQACNEVGIKELTVFAFSTENWNRPADEIDYLMSAPVEYIEEKQEEIEVQEQVSNSSDNVVSTQGEEINTDNSNSNQTEVDLNIPDDDSDVGAFD